MTAIARAPGDRALKAALRAPTMRGGHLIKEARKRVGVTQSELARRLGTSQSLVARWENESVSPRYETLVRAIRACGLDLAVGLYTYDYDHDILIDEQLRLAPQERARRMVAHVEALGRVKQRAKRVDD